jgi:ubiquinone/menaquinone biosynthesis C-methylase UbiE
MFMLRVSPGKRVMHVKSAGHITSNHKIKYSGNYYEEIGNFLGENYLNYGFTKGTLQEIEFLIEHLNLHEGASILDVGCGPGRHSLELARRGFNPIGVDISSSFIELARKKAIKEKLNAQFIVCDARHLQLSQTFNGAICLCEGAFGLVGDDESHRKVLQEVHQVLRPGSIFILTAINALSAAQNTNSNKIFDAYTNTTSDHEIITNSEGESKEVDFYTTSFTYRELKLLLEGTGFKVLNGYGCEAGNFSKKELTKDDIEIMMIAQRL